MPWLIGKPVLLELNRADVAQRRVQSSAVIPEQPVDDFVLDLAPARKALAVQPLHLQRAEQRLAAGVIPAVALATHRAGDAVLPEHVPEVVARVLATPCHCGRSIRPACPDDA
ncbi:hypothetical protein SDC9_140624 [bioreactor metagenome]|uniref:Uncharacterized protein n=1 Tax=bioreactor metagenome TaxID=1076179 RepID=A0A645DVX6_9ZZZZ